MRSNRGYIYLIVNKLNGKTYVGQKRLYTKEWNNDNYFGSGKHLKCAQKKYGIENFEKFLIQYCKSIDELNQQEAFWIEHYRKLGKAEYNICNGGTFGYIHKKGDGPNKGKHHSEETKMKMRLAHIGKCPYIHTPEINEKIGASCRGKTWKVIEGKRVWLVKEEKL